MDWALPWYSSFGSAFNDDFHVTLDEAVALVEYHSRDKATHKQASMPWFSSGERHGVSVVLRDGDSIEHTDSTCARDTDRLNGMYNALDLTPLGRQEDREEPSGRSDTSDLGVGPPPRHILRQERWPGVVIQSIGTPSFEESRKETPDMRYMLLIDKDEAR
jgi:hypothetical protein